MIDARTVPNGSVATHESRMSRTLLQSASCLRSRPMPKIPPDVTCVVDTGSAKGEASVFWPKFQRRIQVRGGRFIRPTTKC